MANTGESRHNLLLWGRSPHGEYVISNQKVDRTAAAWPPSCTQHKAWEVTASWVLTGEDATSNLSPRRPFSPANGGWGAWQLVARYASLDIDNAAFPLFSDPATSATSADSWSVGLNWFLNKNVRFVTSFSRTTFEGGGGAGATAPAIVTRQPENAFTACNLLLTGTDQPGNHHKPFTFFEPSHFVGGMLALVSPKDHTLNVSCATPRANSGRGLATLRSCYWLRKRRHRDGWAIHGGSGQKARSGNQQQPMSHAARSPRHRHDRGEKLLRADWQKRCQTTCAYTSTIVSSSARNPGISWDDLVKPVFRHRTESKNLAAHAGIIWRRLR